jgi:hypothetical protein
LLKYVDEVTGEEISKKTSKYFEVNGDCGKFNHAMNQV